MTPTDPRTPDPLRAGFASIVGSAAGAGDCPAADTIWMAVHREVPPEEIRAVVRHTARCGACAEAWRIEHVALVAEGTVLQGAPAHVPAWRSVWVLGPAAAAAALLVFGVILDSPFQSPRPPTSDVVRTSPAGSIAPLVDDGATLDRAEVVLRWTPTADQSTYAVRVATEDLTVVSQGSALKTPEFRVPESALAKVPPGSRLLWQVTATGADGSASTSPTFVVVVR